jgi:hypothetical protein
MQCHKFCRNNITAYGCISWRRRRTVVGVVLWYGATVERMKDRNERARQENVMTQAACFGCSAFSPSLVDIIGHARLGCLMMSSIYILTIYISIKYRRHACKLKQLAYVLSSWTVAPQVWGNMLTGVIKVVHRLFFRYFHLLHVHINLYLIMSILW